MPANTPDRIAQMDNWLKQHNATKVGDIVFDRCGIISEISKEHIFGYYIIITPLQPDMNIGNGIGGALIISF